MEGIGSLYQPKSPPVIFALLWKPPKESQRIKPMKQKDFLIINPHGKEQIISERMACELGRQVRCVGQVLEIQYRKKGTNESISRDEFQKRCVKVSRAEQGAGKWIMVREVEKGWEQYFKIDKNSRPRQDFRKTVITESGTVPKVEWFRMKEYGR